MVAGDAAERSVEPRPAQDRGRGRLFDVANHLFLILLSLSILLPFMRQITISLKHRRRGASVRRSPRAGFRKVTLASYERIFQTDSIARAY